MTETVTRKLFRNGGSWAIRIPKDFLPSTTELELFLRQDGVLELRPLAREQRMQNLLKRLSESPELAADAFPIPTRGIEIERFDWKELWGSEEQ